MKTYLTLAAAAFVAASAQASIVSTSGQMTQIAPPPSLQTGQQAFGTYAVAIDEKQNISFNGIVDRLGPSFATNYTNSNVASMFYAGPVNSHIIHFDDTNVGNPRNNIVGTVTFDTPIIALIYTNTRLDQTDAQCGNIGTTVYPLGVGNRGFSVAYSGLDTARVLNAYTIEVTLGAAIDQIRVLTYAVPSPGAAALLPLTALLAPRRRRSA